MKALRDTKLLALLTLVVGMIGAGLVSLAAGPATREPAQVDRLTASLSNSVLTTSNWYIDPQNVTGCAADTNSCTSATCGATGVGPCATWGQIAGRYGTTEPVLPYGQSVTTTLLSAQSAGTDSIFFEPRLSGGGQNILMVSRNLAATIIAGTIVARTQGAPGNLLTVVFPGGTVPVKNELVVNTMRGSQALIDSVSEQTATMQQPQTTASLTTTAVVPAPVEDNTWTTGDPLSIYTIQNVNLKQWGASGCDETAASQPTSSWVFYASVADTSTTGASQWINRCNAIACSVVNSVVNGRMSLSTAGGRGEGQYIVGSTVTNSTLMVGPEGETFGGAYNGVSLNGGNVLFANDVILHGVNSVIGGFFNGAAFYSDGSFGIEQASLTVSSVAWGSYSVLLDPQGQWLNATGSTFALKALLTSSTNLKFGTSTTGSAYTGSGVWVDGITITPAHIDTGGTAGVGLTDPLTGARFSDNQ